MIAKQLWGAVVATTCLCAALEPALALERQVPSVPSTMYLDLPTRVRITPGTALILKSRCDNVYPMDESIPCDSATGGPSGGRGS